MTEKRKADFITLDSEPLMKTTKDELPYQNFKLFDDDKEGYKLINNKIQQYINLFNDISRKFENDSNRYSYSLKMFIETLEKLKKEKENFFTQKHFENFIVSFSNDLEQSKDLSQLLNHNFEFNLELRRMLMPPSTSDSNDKSNGLQLKKNAKNLTKALVKVQNQISVLENKELGEEDMNGPSVFTKLPSLKKLQVKLWKQREDLLQRSQFTGQHMAGGFSFKNSPTLNKKVDGIIEKFYIRHLNLLKHEEDKIIFKKRGKSKQNNRNYFSFFSIIDLKKHLTEEIKNAKINFDLNDSVLENIYNILLKDNQNRRLQDQMDSFRSLEALNDLKPSNMADENDLEFKKKLKENNEIWEKDLKKIEDEYIEKDKEENGENINEKGEFGWDDIESSSHSSDDDEDEEDEDSEPDEDFEKKILDEINQQVQQ